MLTPSDIEQKTFHTSLRGYNLDEVDDFLDEVVSTLRELQDRLAAGGGGGPASTDEGSAVGRALTAAQATAEEMLSDARAEAEKLVADAREEAENWVAERDAKRAQAADEVKELSLRVAEMRAHLAALATAVGDRLDEMDRALDIPLIPESTDPSLPVEVEPDPTSDVIEGDQGWHEDLS